MHLKQNANLYVGTCSWTVLHLPQPKWQGMREKREPGGIWNDFTRSRGWMIMHTMFECSTFQSVRAATEVWRTGTISDGTGVRLSSMTRAPWLAVCVLARVELQVQSLCNENAPGFNSQHSWKHVKNNVPSLTGRRFLTTCELVA